MTVSGDASEFFSLAAQLTRASGQIGAAAAGAVRSAARDIEARAKAQAPVGPTGDLRDSISTTLTGDGRFAAIDAEIGPSVDYAPFVEYGTSRMGPQPFMGPAFEARQPGLARDLGTLDEGLL